MPSCFLKLRPRYWATAPQCRGWILVPIFHLLLCYGGKPSVDIFVFLVVLGLNYIWQRGAKPWELQKPHALKTVRREPLSYGAPGRVGRWVRGELVAGRVVVAEWNLWYWTKCRWGCFREHHLQASDYLNREGLTIVVFWNVSSSLVKVLLCLLDQAYHPHSINICWWIINNILTWSMGSADTIFECRVLLLTSCTQFSLK